jgi:hypothetical protein
MIIPTLLPPSHMATSRACREGNDLGAAYPFVKILKCRKSVGARRRVNRYSLLNIGDLHLWLRRGLSAPKPVSQAVYADSWMGRPSRARDGKFKKPTAARS